MPALAALLTNSLLIFPLLIKTTPTDIVTPLAYGEVLGAKTENSSVQPPEEFHSLIGQIIDQSSTTPAPTTTFSQDIFPKTFKGNIKILVLGGTQTKLLQNGESLITKLSQYYPKIKFDFVNYSSNQSDINYALAKTNDTFLENGTQQSSVIFQEPDILFIDTFGYDPELQDKTDVETQAQKLNNLANLVFSYNKSQNIFLTNLLPTPSNFSNIFPNDPNQQYSQATKTTENITVINKNLTDKNLPIIDITTPSLPDSVNTDQFLDNNLVPTPAGLEMTEAKIMEYLISNQIIDKALETQKLF